MVEVSFGEWLKRQRKASGLTQEQLAQQVSCSTITLRKIEAEERRPSAQTVERLAKIFNIPQNEQAAFLRFARGDWRAAPTDSVEEAPWRAASQSRERDASVSKIGLATFLFTDIENSTKLWEAASEQMKTALQRHHQILEEVITSHGGIVFQIIGDAFCAAFPTVLSAVSAAVKAQQELHQETWDLPFPVRVRMGIHTGEAEQTSTGDYASNPTLNRVARILNAAHGGQILLSLATKDLVKDSLPQNAELRDMGEHYLKNLRYPEHLFQLNIAGLPSDFPPLNTLTHRHNLPIQVTSFIAREPEIALVHEYLSKGSIRLVTLIGPPGIGKTRLSIEAARTALSDFPDGVFFVALAPLDDPTRIASTIAQALGYAEARNVSTIEQLKEGMGDKHLLLVLDNCEHLIEAVASLASDLLFTCSHLKMLATSRESLRIPGEWLYAVPAFDLPTEISSLDMESAARYPALALFAERARAVRSDFSLKADNIETITEICARLDGLPLVIELIAARIRLMPPQALLHRLSGQFVLTADGMRAPSERQKTLYNAIDWSYQLLPPEEQKLFAYLSVFSGGFTLSAAESIFSQRFTEKSVPDLIASLLDKSLIQRSSALHDEVRFTVLVTIQQFALTCLRQMSEEAPVRDWHLAYFLDLAEQADKQIHGSDQLKWINCIEDELDNFRAALSWCVSEQRTESALILLTSLSYAWDRRDHSHEMRNWFNAIRLLPDVVDRHLLYARLLNHIGQHSWVLGDFDYARSVLEESHAILVKLGVEGEPDLAMNLCWFGMVAHTGEADNKAARSFYEHSFELYQKHGNLWGMASISLNLGLTISEWNDDDSALPLLKQSLEWFRQLGDAWGMGRVSQCLGQLFLRQGSYERARRYFEDHLKIDESLRFSQGTAIALQNLGNLHRYQGNYDEAIQFYEKSLLLSRDYGGSWDLGNSLWYLGLTALHRNDYQQAQQQFIDYYNLAHEVYGGGIGECDFLTGMAAVAGGTNHPKRATKLNGAAQALFETMDYQLQPFDRAEFDRHIRIAEEQLGGAKFEELISEGYAMTMEQAIAYALELPASE